MHPCGRVFEMQSNCYFGQAARNIWAFTPVSTAWGILGRYMGQRVPLSLLWREASQESIGGEPKRKSDTYFAQSWSWASAMDLIEGTEWNYTEVLADVSNALKIPRSSDNCR